MVRKICAISVWLWLLGFPGVLRASDGPDVSLLPPVQTPLPVTSSFGEYRQGHYHGGVDFSTGGREGVPVIAPRDGWVFRLRASGVGYGKAVYFRLDDGRTVLYAHLSRFHPRLESVLEAAQDRARRYEIDLRPEPGEIPFEAGEILGYSGQTGAGVPHIHAEMRVGEEASVAVNPLNQGWSIDDPRPPRLSRLLVAPARAGVLVDGGVEPVTLSLDGSDDGSPAFRTTGPVRVWVEAEDRAANPAYRLAPSRIVATVDGEERVDVDLDRFHWNWAREVEWTFHSARARRDKERWVLLEAPPGGRQGITTEPGGGLVSDLEPGSHLLALDAFDANGNHTAASVSFALDPEVSSPVLSGPRVTGNRVLSRGRTLEVHLPARPGEEVSLLARGPKGDRDPGEWTRFEAPGGWIYQWDAPGTGNPELWWFFREDEAGEIPIGQAVHTGGEGAADPRRTVIETAGVALDLKPGTTYGPQWITFAVGGTPRVPADAPELEPTGYAIELDPWALPLRERMSLVWLAGPGDSDGLALCKKTSGGWSYLGSDTSDRGVGATLGSLETVALFRDRVPPRITFDPVSEKRVTRLRCRIEDGGVGVHWSAMEMTLDGETVVAEWDPEAGAYTGLLRAPLEPGEHRLEVRASDRVGNASRRETTITVP